MTPESTIAAHSLKSLTQLLASALIGPCTAVSHRITSLVTGTSERSQTERAVSQQQARCHDVTLGKKKSSCHFPSFSEKSMKNVLGYRCPVYFVLFCDLNETSMGTGHTLSLQ